MRPQSQSAAVLLGGAPLTSDGAAVRVADLDDDDSFGVNTSRFSTYTREEVKKLDKSLLIWMERLTTTPTSSTEDLTTSTLSSPTTPSLSPSSSLTSSPISHPHKRLPPPILTSRGLGIFSEGLPSPPSSTTTCGSPKSAPTTPRGRGSSLRRWWKSTAGRDGDADPNSDGAEAAEEWEVVSSATPEDPRSGQHEGETVKAAYATVHPSPRIRPRSKSVAAVLRRKTRKVTGKGKSRSATGSLNGD
ncbi:hypothetical protein RQP46_000888 [Phenoliferia psychrophenolica]